MAAMQGCVALSHLSGLRLDIIPWAYGTVVAGWAYAMLVVLIIATCRHRQRLRRYGADPAWYWQLPPAYRCGAPYDRSEEHTSELQSLMRISYAVFCLKKKNNTKIKNKKHALSHMTKY